MAHVELTYSWVFFPLAAGTVTVLGPPVGSRRIAVVGMNVSGNPGAVVAIGDTVGGNLLWTINFVGVTSSGQVARGTTAHPLFILPAGFGVGATVFAGGSNLSVSLSTYQVPA